MAERQPKRLRRQRTKGWTMPEGAVYVGRPTKWGNPYPVSHYGEIAAELFEKDLRSAIASPWLEPHTIEFRRIAESIEELRGKDLVCWCKPGDPCHADVLLELANRMTATSGARPTPSNGGIGPEAAP